VAHLSNLSAGYALFELVDGELLRPVRLHPLARYHDDLITIPKYAGKTNEQFTKLLLNVTVLASASAQSMLDGTVTVLDPLCGRGTTLNQALMYGYHAIGIELDGKDVDAYAAFLRTWLRRKRLKHTSDLHPVRRDRRTVARCFEAVVGDRRAGEPQRVTVYHADTTRARDFLRAGGARQPYSGQRAVPPAAGPAPGGRPGLGRTPAPRRSGRRLLEHPRRRPGRAGEDTRRCWPRCPGHPGVRWFRTLGRPGDQPGHPGRP
jgi:hypothetical protein